jgi:hypothetical protein
VKKLFSFWRWIVGAAIVFGAITFVAYKQHDAVEKYRRHHQEYCSALVASAEQTKACTEEGTSAKDYMPWGYELVAWPDGITTWAIIFTGFAIVWQSWETRKAGEAALKSVQLQEVQYRQWVEIGGWKNWSRVQPQDTEATLSLGFEIQNNTSFPLTLLSIKTSRAAQSSSGSLKGCLISPKDVYDAFFAFDVSPAELQLYRLDNLAATLTIEVVIKDVLEKESAPQKFSRTITFGPNRCDVVSHPRHFQLAIKQIG